MQTFLPEPGFVTTARLLDDRRLGKQRVECFQILRALTWHRYAWKNHPAVAMWRGFVPALVRYTVEMCTEWARRGFTDALLDEILRFTGGRVPTARVLAGDGRLPPWLGRDAVHRSHRSALVRKDPRHYRGRFPDVPDDLPYVWPAPAFPRWPVRRGRAEILPLPDAVAALGLTELLPEQQAAVDAVLAGRDHALSLPPGPDARAAALLAGLCSPGRTAWITPGALPPLEDGGDQATSPGSPSGRPRTSVARPPSEADAAGVAAEATADAEFRFFRTGQDPAALALDGVGLVVHDAVPAAAGRIDGDHRLRGVPRLRLQPPGT